MGCFDEDAGCRQSPARFGQHQATGSLLGQRRVELGLRQRLPLAFYLSVTVAVLGVALLASPDDFRPPGFGDALVLTAALIRAAHVALTARLLRPGDDVALIVAIQLVTGAAMFLPIALPGLAGIAPTDLSAVIGHALFLGLGCSVFAFLVQAWAVQRTSAARASLLMGTEPLWAVALGLGIAGDRLLAPQAFGVALILAGTMIGAGIERRARERRVSAPGSGEPESELALSRKR